MGLIDVTSCEQAICEFVNVCQATLEAERTVVFGVVYATGGQQLTTNFTMDEHQPQCTTARCIGIGVLIQGESHGRFVPLPLPKPDRNSNTSIRTIR